jgi:hypothetical protein
MVDAELVKGDIIYPHRKDLYELNFYQCPTCNNYVGTHKGTDKPLGHIVTKEIKQLRIKIHNFLDPIWKNGRMKRKDLYKKISDKLGYMFHVGEIVCEKEADNIIKIVEECDNG